MKPAIFWVCAAALGWFAWIMIDNLINLQERLTAAEERARQVIIPYRQKWICKPVERHPGAHMCFEPNSKGGV